MNSHKQWIRDPEHPTQWILNPNFHQPQVDPPMQIQPIEEVIQLPVVVESPHVELPQIAEPPSMQIQPIHEPIIQLPVVEVPQVTSPPPMQIQPIADPIQLPGLIDSPSPSPTPLFHPGFLCLGAEMCPHFSHQTQMPPRGSPSNNIVFLPVVPPNSHRI